MNEASGRRAIRSHTFGRENYPPYILQLASNFNATDIYLPFRGRENQVKYTMHSQDC